MSAVPKDVMPVTQGQIAILEEMIGERIARVEERCRALEAENNELRKRVKVLTDRADAEEVANAGRAVTVFADEFLTSSQKRTGKSKAAQEMRKTREQEAHATTIRELLKKSW